MDWQAFFLTVKLAVVGFGAAEKVQVAHMIRVMLTLDGKLSADASDALARLRA